MSPEAGEGYGSSRDRHGIEMIFKSFASGRSASDAGGDTYSRLALPLTAPVRLDAALRAPGCLKAPEKGQGRQKLVWGWRATLERIFI